MSLRIIYYYIKARGYIGFFLSIGLFMGILAFAIAPRIGVWFSVFLTILATIALSLLLVSGLSRSEIDFVFSTPMDPRFIFLGRFMADWLVYLLLLTIYMMFFALSTTTPQRPEPDLALYAVSIFAWTTILDAIVYLLLFSRYENEKLARHTSIAVGVLIAFLTLEFTYLISTLITIVSIIVTLVYLPLWEYYANEFYTNAYGLLERPQLHPRPAKAPAVAPGPMPRGLWQLAWRTTFIIVSIKETLAISAAGAAAYLLIVFFNPQWLVDATVVSALFLLVSLWLSLSAGLRLERFWISFSADHYAYVRYRMAARSLASLLATSPWIFAYALVSLRYPPAAHVAALLVSASLAFPILAWLKGALSGQLKIREYGLVQRPVRYAAKLLLSLLLGTAKLLLAFLPMGIAILYLLFAHFWHCMLILSAAFFYIALFTRLGRRIWDWLVDRLAAAGHV